MSLKWLSVPEMIAYRQVIKGKMKYYQNLFDEAALAEEQNQDDYGMLASIQDEMDYAEERLMRCEKKLERINRLIIAKSVEIWMKKK